MCDKVLGCGQPPHWRTPLPDTCPKSTAPCIGCTTASSQEGTLDVDDQLHFSPTEFQGHAEDICADGPSIP